MVMYFTGNQITFSSRFGTRGWEHGSPSQCLHIPWADCLLCQMLPKWPAKRWVNAAYTMNIVNPQQDGFCHLFHTSVHVINNAASECNM